MSCAGDRDLAVLHVLGVHEGDLVDEAELAQQDGADQAVEVAAGDQAVRAGMGRLQAGTGGVPARHRQPGADGLTCLLSSVTSSPLLAAVAARRGRARRMKRTATALLATAAACSWSAPPSLPDTTCCGTCARRPRPGTVGGLADWFAVTALFRHPLGIPVPHTALVARKKDELATKLGEFVTGNFLTGDAVAGQLAEAQVVRRAAGALAAPGNASAVSVELAAALVAVLDTLDEDRITAYALELARRDLGRRSYAPVLGAFLARALEGGVQRPLVDIAVQRTRAYLEEHGEDLVPHLKRLLEVHWASVLVDTGKLSRRLMTTATQILREAERDPDHALRAGLDELLDRFATDLRYSPRTSRDVDARLRGLLEDPQVQLLVRDLLRDVRASVRTSLADGGRRPAARLADLVRDAALRVSGDADLERRLQDRLLGAVRYAVEHYGDTAVQLIQRTVASWEARDASRRIETAVGRDLQFIRINGTVVGALAGVVLHAVETLVT